MSADPPSAAERLDALEAVCDALAHPARRQILLTVHFRGGAMAAGEIAGRFAHAWPTTTRHLKVLEAAGLLTSERAGRAVVYRIDRARLSVLQEWLAWFSDPTPQTIAPREVAEESESQMIRGIHGMFYSNKDKELRAFLRDKLGLPATDIGGGWLIFDFDMGDLGVHPIDHGGESGQHDISFFTDDLEGTVADLKKKGVKLDDEIADHGYGYVTHLTMPGGVRVQIYQPKYPKKGLKPKAVGAKKGAKKKASKPAPAPKRAAKKKAAKKR
ncbi:MAG TPA: metalloregulator ArsR/SmtB family transcription factor [Nannocystaceae bacterium]|nr:metalloregulator ArsR/SmtB family transcription factor [Nannocystaceae bacterium]